MNRLLLIALAALALESLRGQESAVSLRSAVELSIPTTRGLGYQVREADTLGAWQLVGSQIFGDGTVVTLRLPSPKPTHFFQTDTFAVSNLNLMLESVR